MYGSGVSQSNFIESYARWMPKLIIHKIACFTENAPIIPCDSIHFSCAFFFFLLHIYSLLLLFFPLSLLSSGLLLKNVAFATWFGIHKLIHRKIKWNKKFKFLASCNRRGLKEWMKGRRANKRFAYLCIKEVNHYLSEMLVFIHTHTISFSMCSVR